MRELMDWQEQSLPIDSTLLPALTGAFRLASRLIGLGAPLPRIYTALQDTFPALRELTPLEYLKLWEYISQLASF